MNRTEAPIRITVLVENAAARPDLGTEHGLSYWIECGNSRILFDTGQSDLFARNAAALGIDIGTATAIVLSHGHYDHTGGLKEGLKRSPGTRVFLHPDALRPKYSRNKAGPSRPIGLTCMGEAELRASARVVETRLRCEVAPGLYVTGRIPRANNFEDTGGAFYTDAEGLQPDRLDDDQAMFFRSARGVVVVLGCAHAGVVNTIDHIRAAFQRSIYAVIGGMHLHAASDQRLQCTLEALQRHDIKLLAPAHCTGEHATQRLCARFAGRCRACHAGSQFEFAQG